MVIEKIKLRKVADLRIGEVNLLQIFRRKKSKRCARPQSRRGRYSEVSSDNKRNNDSRALPYPTREFLSSQRLSLGSWRILEASILIAIGDRSGRNLVGWRLLYICRCLSNIKAEPVIFIFVVLTLCR